MNGKLTGLMNQMHSPSNGGKARNYDDETMTVLRLEAEPDFVETPYVRELTKRSLRYLGAGFALHLRGAAGTGKTTLAMHVANQLGHPVMLLHGDEEWATSDLVGGEYGFHSRKMVDNFIHSVLKTEEDMVRRWVDNRLTIACEQGFTLIYDEFNRSRPEANNVLLSVLEERMLNLPRRSREGMRDYLRVHPDFCAIFTSNPEEYAGVHKIQDALLDRMMTIDLAFPDHTTEVAITQAKSTLPYREAERIVDLVRAARERCWGGFKPTLRANLMIARVLAHAEARAQEGDLVFETVCRNVLLSNAVRGMSEKDASVVSVEFDQLLKKCCPSPDASGNGRAREPGNGRNEVAHSPTHPLSYSNQSAIPRVSRGKLHPQSEMSQEEVAVQ